MAETSEANRYQINDDSEMTSYKKDAVSVVSFKVVYNKDDFNLDKFINFKPLMAHQVFGESESIFGYRSLSVSLFYTHNSSHCLVCIKTAGAIAHDGMYKPDDIIGQLNQWLPEKYTTDKDHFKKMLDNEKHNLIFGTVLNEFKDSQECQLFPGKQVYADYKITLCDLSNEDFKDFHRRFETFIIWYIDGANFIDLDDERWLIFYVYEQFQHPDTNEQYATPVGYCTVYKFFAYPNNIRARISQFFVIPSHQRRGIGTVLYNTVFDKIREIEEAIDVTVEEPTETFQKIRDLDDCLLICKDLSTSKLDIQINSSKMIFEIMKKRKICKKQCQRVYDILLGLQTLTKEEVHAKYLENIKNRIQNDIERETHGSKRLCNLEGLGIAAEATDKSVIIEAEFKKYMDAIEEAIANLQIHLKMK